MTTLIVYMIHCAFNKRAHLKSFCQQFGPLILTVVATFLIMADLTRHVLMDNGIWVNALGMYRNNCNSESLFCLSVLGYVVTIGCTYTGFLCLFVATLWNANIMSKVRLLRVQMSELWSRYRSSKNNNDSVPHAKYQAINSSV
eukprot:TRINITY_DN15600_c0_g1_i1.p1 TRINITY_DN15600_c0_g1~~TRINITY_DN15600_c0_g1_i1.p1  ORF type:complete len:143 (-),score=42.06 TRINITY_DN15600_c0_g1_i1:13-441(-)